MKASVQFIEDKVAQFNQLCFQGSLPPIPVKLASARSYLGKVTYTGRRGFFGRVLKNEGFTLRISSVFDLQEREWEDVVIHELIHYYIAFNCLRDTSTHGQLFRKMMNDINQKYGRNITVRHHSKAGELPVKGNVQRTVNVCISRLSDGNWGVTVCSDAMKAKLNRLLPRYYRLSSMDWYRTDNSLFNRYPCSRTPKIYRITQEEVSRFSGEASEK